ncbi:MAG: glycosyltransferase family 4 protein [Microcystaceae cyanobacterium]
MTSTSSHEPPCVIFVAYRGLALTRSRLQLVKAFLQEGWQVVAAMANDDYAQPLQDLGVKIEPVNFYRGGLSLITDLKAAIVLHRIYQKYKPQLIHLFHIKPLILGNFLAKFSPDSVVVTNIEGLGYALVAGGIIQMIASLGYRATLSRSDCVIFLNPDDQKLFIEQQWLVPEKTRLIISSGIDTNQFTPDLNSTSHGFNILMVTRLLSQKGIKEFIEAAEIVKQQYPDVCFQLAGEWDTIHPNSVDPEYVYQAVKEGKIEFLGFISDMVTQLQNTSIFVLPSYYREGVPRVLLEAAACSVPVVTTDWTGCRETVVDEETGYLVPPQNSQALAKAIFKILALSSEERQLMGDRSRQRVKELFDVPVVTEQYLKVYREFNLKISGILAS